MGRLVRSSIRVSLMAAVLGAAVSVSFLVFEWLVNHGTPWLWNDLLQTDTIRWLVVPTAVVLSVLLTVLMQQLGESRLPHASPDVLADHPSPPSSVRQIAAVFIVGVASLLAGASLGPEASLMLVAAGLGSWLAHRSNQPEHRLFSLAAVGALLVAFFGSLFPAVIPLLLLIKEHRRLKRSQIAVVVVAAAASFVTALLIQGKVAGYGSIPISGHWQIGDLLTAAGYAVVGVLVAILTKQLIVKFGRLATQLAQQLPWWLLAGFFGLVIGLLYWVGGPTVQFSGREGAPQLVHDAGSLGSLAVLGILMVKVVVTAWSEATGYRGGLVFPSIFSGVALSVLAGTMLPEISGPGAVVGSVGGIIAGMTSPAVGAVMLLSLLPVSYAVLAIASVCGAAVSMRLLRLINPTNHSLRS